MKRWTRTCFLMSIPALAIVLAFSCLAAVAKVSEAAEKAPQIIVLKLDDVTSQGGSSTCPVSSRWQRLVDFLEKSQIKASFGIIGFSLEQDNPAYFDWIKNLHKKGMIEFWNHGYRERKSEDKTAEFEESLEVQTQSLKKTQALAKEKLGIELKVFGPHWSGTTRDTATALAEVPEIVMWYYGPKDWKNFAFEPVLTLENPIFVPDSKEFARLYQQGPCDKKCLALQGHPNMWDDQRWAGFVEIIAFLKSQGCVFMTPSEYYARPGVSGGHY